MAKKHPSPSARMIMEKMYAGEKQNVKPGPLADAMHEFNEYSGLSDPRTVLVKNLGPSAVDHIQPGEYGVVKPTSASKFLKRVTVKPSESKSKSKEAK